MSKNGALIKISDLWRWDGTIDRLPYAIWGTGLVAVKFTIDNYLSTVLFHRAWSWLNYISPGQAIDVLSMNTADQRFYAWMLVFSLPFIWIGIVLTVRRLRGAGLPVWLCKLFFLPVINLVVFSTLCILPTQSNKNIFDRDDAEIEGPADRPLHISQGEPLSDSKAQLADRNDSNKSLPAPKDSKGVHPHEIGSTNKKSHGVASGAGFVLSEPVKASKESIVADAVYAMVMTVPVAALLSYVGVTVLKTYGWSLFVGVPFAVGMASAYFYGRNHMRSIGQCLLVAALALTLVGAAMFLYAWEGMICLIMAAPIAYALALMGALLGYSMQKKKNLPVQHTRAAIIALLFVLPLSMGADYVDKAEFPTCAVHTTCLIQAPPSTVWKYIIAFPKLSEPQEWIFHTGVAYPIGATIDGEGAGAIRHCKFSTGTFVEPITIWQKPNLLQFAVLSQPEPMKELSIVHNIQPAHLNGYLNVHKGEFRLSEIVNKDGSIGTQVVGTTWYDNHMWPGSYWRIYADGIMHSIHTRVLKHIKSISESDIAHHEP